MWTLVGAGLKNLDESIQSMSVVMPRNVKWIKEKAAKFDPKENVVYTETDRQVRELLYSKFNFSKNTSRTCTYLLLLYKNSTLGPISLLFLDQI